MHSRTRCHSQAVPSTGLRASKRAAYVFQAQCEFALATRSVLDSCIWCHLAMSYMIRSCALSLRCWEHPRTPQNVVGADRSVGGTECAASHPSGCSGLDPLSRISAVFSKLGLPRSCSQSSQRSWNEFNSGPSYLWDSPATDPSPSWPASSSSPTHAATVSTHAPSLLVFPSVALVWTVL